MSMLQAQRCSSWLSLLQWLAVIACQLTSVTSWQLNAPSIAKVMRHQRQHDHDGIISTPPRWLTTSTSSQRKTIAGTVAAAKGGEEGTVTASNIIDGKQVASAIRGELKKMVADMADTTGLVPGLAVILVGQRADSATYVRMKKKACEEVGVASFGFDFPDDVSQAELIDTIGHLNQRSDVHGILVQLPLPQHVDEGSVLHAVSPEKDVDGLHPMNVAALFSCSTRQGTITSTSASFDMSAVDFHIPCTPQGCIELLDRCGVAIAGKHAVVIGRSNMVGLPVAMLLLHRGATVTVVHSRTMHPETVVRQADIVVAAVGRAGLVTKEWVKEGAIVIDVGINTVADASKKSGYRLVGDVAFEEVSEVASLITPVPGGVGPMTIAMLLSNTLKAAVRAVKEGARAVGAGAGMLQ